MKDYTDVLYMSEKIIKIQEKTIEAWKEHTNLMVRAVLTSTNLKELKNIIKKLQKMEEMEK